MKKNIILIFGLALILFSTQSFVMGKGWSKRVKELNRLDSKELFNAWRTELKKLITKTELGKYDFILKKDIFSNKIRLKDSSKIDSRKKFARYLKKRIAVRLFNKIKKSRYDNLPFWDVLATLEQIKIIGTTGENKTLINKLLEEIKPMLNIENILKPLEAKEKINDYFSAIIALFTENIELSALLPIIRTLKSMGVSSSFTDKVGQLEQLKKERLAEEEAARKRKKNVKKKKRVKNEKSKKKKNVQLGWPLKKRKKLKKQKKKLKKKPKKNVWLKRPLKKKKKKRIKRNF